VAVTIHKHNEPTHYRSRTVNVDTCVLWPKTTVDQKMRLLGGKVNDFLPNFVVFVRFQFRCTWDIPRHDCDHSALMVTSDHQITEQEARMLL